MRKKIKQLMNKEEGFTLVELLAVIVILGIIVAIAIPSIGGVINRAQNNADAAEKDLIVEAARVYAITEYDSLFDGTTTEETVDSNTLIAKGYLEDRGDTALTNIVVTITKTASTNQDGTVSSDPVDILKYSVPE